jgi:predicted MFS family arabinose efflux permease
VVPAPYKRLLAIRAARTPIIGAGIGRLPIAGLSLATILLVRAETNSFAIAGVVEAASAIAAAFSLPIQGRLVDRVGQTKVLVPIALFNPLSLVALVAAADAGAPPAVLAIIGAASGASIPALSPCMRTLWATLVDDPRLRQSAFALDAALLEASFVIGPLMTAVLASAGSPGTAVLVNAAFATAGTLVFALSRASRSWRGTPSDMGWAGPLRSPAIAALVLVELAFGAAIGAMEISTTALATSFGTPAFAGVLISVQGAASMFGGLWYGSRHHAKPAAERYPRLCLLIALGFAPLLLTSTEPNSIVLLIISGFAFAPAGAVLYTLIDEVAPRGTATEASTWMITAIVAGLAAGNAIAGSLVSGGHPHRGYAFAIGAAVVAFLIAFRARPRLRLATQAT